MDVKLEYPELDEAIHARHAAPTANGDGRVEMEQADIDAIIRNKRKARDPKACYACHRRKVKCDRNLPCDSCVKRDHPELCSYERPTKKRRIVLAGPLPDSDHAGHDYNPPPHGHQQDYGDAGGGNITVSHAQWTRLNNELARLQIQNKSVTGGGHVDTALLDDETGLAGTEPTSRDESDKEGIHAPSAQMGTMHLGSRSVLAYLNGLNRSDSYQQSAKALLEENILPKLGLDNETATYPFVDLWSTDSSLHDVSGLLQALPDDGLIEEFWVAYRDTACTIYPVVPDKVVFANKLNHMLHNRRQMRGSMNAVDPDKPYGVSVQWLALLFAVLASGTQSTDRHAKERELTSQVYICCAYQALRMANFLTHPSLEVIQAFLVIGNVLSYNMNPGVSYIILGMTMRTAFSIGLHVDSEKFTPLEQYLRNHTWWTLAWQDSHFSVSYDRPSASALCTPEIPYRPQSTPGTRSYAESMMRIIKLTQEIIRDRQLNPRTTMSWTTIQSYKQEIARIVADAAIHHREREHCLITTQHLERLALRLHCSYITSELCRPALKETGSHSGSTPSGSPSHNRRKSSHGNSELPLVLRGDCIVSLEATIDAYVELYGYSKFAARSWVGIQRAVSAAFLIGTLHETNTQPRIHKLLQQLEQVIHSRTIEDPTFVDPDLLDHPSNSDPNLNEQRQGASQAPQWAKSMTKSLKALSKLNLTLAGPGPQSMMHNMQPNQNQQQQQHQNHQPAAGQHHNNPGFHIPLPQQQKYPTSSGPAPYGNNATGGSNGIPGGIMMPGGGPSPNSGMYPNSAGNVFSPGGGFPITPDSTSSGEWNYSNLEQRVSEFIPPPLWN